jgi:hypothetical protein
MPGRKEPSTPARAAVCLLRAPVAPADIPTLHYKEGRLSRDFVAFFNSNKTSLLVSSGSMRRCGSNIASARAALVCCVAGVRLPLTRTVHLRPSATACRRS